MAGFFLKDLKEKGLDDNTIIFFSDHGGCVPRGKGYLYESGLEVPLIAYPAQVATPGGRKGIRQRLFFGQLHRLRTYRT